MKFTNRLMLTAVLMFAISIVSFAQRGEGRGERPSPEEMAQRQTERLTKALELSEDQAQKIEAINLKYIEQAQAKRAEMRGQEDVDREAVRAEREKMLEAQKAEMKTVLNETQFAEYEELLANRQGNGKRKGKKGKKGKKEKEDQGNR